MSIIEALCLGAVQGITEFLPVSSSGHLVLLQTIFGITEPVLLFDTLVHVGTLAAVVAALREDIWALLKKPGQPLFLFLVIATIPAVVAALLFKDAIETAFHSPAFLGFAFLITSGLLFFSERAFRRESGVVKGGRAMNWFSALVIGVFQAAAIVPGISRSGATLSAGLFQGLEREKTARFSFLLSIPVILGALVFQLRDIAAPAAEAREAAIGAGPLALGALTAALVGFFSIRVMLRMVKERSLTAFAWYTGILGVCVLIDRFGTRFFF